jgi:hypothetical protein
MTVTPSLVISIDHTGVAGASEPLVFSAAPGSPLGITDYREPASEAALTRVGGAGNIHGDGVVTEWSYQEANHAWSFFTDADSETESRAQLVVVRAFLGRMRYSLTVSTSDAPDETWVCYAGSLSPAAGRSRIDLARSFPVWNVVIPCHPIRS